MLPLVRNEDYDKITLKEIATMADVSVMTVSNVIRGKDSRVSAETKAKIQALVKSIIMFPTKMQPIYVQENRN